MNITYKAYLDNRHSQVSRLAATLAPCPVCGVDGEQDVDLFIACEPRQLDNEQADGKPGVYCGNCGMVLCGETASGAIEAWNAAPINRIREKLSEMLKAD